MVKRENVDRILYIGTPLECFAFIKKNVKKGDMLVRGFDKGRLGEELRN